MLRARLGFNRVVAPRSRQHGRVIDAKIRAIFHITFVTVILDTQAHLAFIALFHMPHTRIPCFGFDFLYCAVFVIDGSGIVRTVYLTWLAQAHTKTLLVFVIRHEARAHIAPIEHIVMLVTQADTRAFFRIVAQARIKFLPWYFLHRHFHRHTVALQLVKFGGDKHTAVMAVLFKRILQIDNFVTVVSIACFEFRQFVHNAFWIALGAIHGQVAKENGLIAVDFGFHLGRILGGVYGGFGMGHFCQWVLLATHATDGCALAAAPSVLQERLAHIGSPALHGIGVILTQFFIV